MHRHTAPPAPPRLHRRTTPGVQQKDWAGVNDVRWLPLVNSDPRNLHLITDVKPLDGPRFANFTA